MKALVSWSSGKDSAWALHVVQQDRSVDVVGLLTTINRTYGRVAMHGVRRELLDAQAVAAGLPLWTVEIPRDCNEDQYEALLLAALDEVRGAGIEAVAFGDLFLQGVRKERERQLRLAELQPLFPLWGRDTKALALEMLASGIVAHVACVDPRLVSDTFKSYESGRTAAPACSSRA